MNISRNLYENLPLYARITDEQDILQLFLERGIQIELDQLYEVIANRGVLYDPTQRASEPHLDWIGQLFGLYRGKSGSWVGIGLNPQWSADHKRFVIAEISEYWRNKGTNAGFVQALKLWMQWEQPVVKFTYPLANNWFSYGDSFAPEIDKRILERKRLGSGDYFPGNTYQPHWQIEQLVVDEEDDSLVLTVPVDGTVISQSRLGEHNVWLELFPDSIAIWNRLIQYLPRLAIETFDVRAIVTSVIWWELTDEELSTPAPKYRSGRITMTVIGENYIYRNIIGAMVVQDDITSFEFLFRPYATDKIQHLLFYDEEDQELTTTSNGAAGLRELDPAIFLATKIIVIPVAYKPPPFSLAVAAVEIDPQDPNDPYLGGSGNAGGSATTEGFDRSPFTLSSFRTDLTSLVAPPDVGRDYLGLALFWAADNLHWLIYGDGANTTTNYARNRIFYYRSQITDDTITMVLQDHVISEVINPADISIIPTPQGTGVTFRGRRQLAYGGAIEDYRRYIFEVNSAGEAILHSRLESEDQEGNGSLGTGQEVVGILGNKMITYNGIGGSGSTGSFVWNSLAGLEVIPIKNSVTPGSPINENYYDGSGKYVPANNVVDRYEPYNVWGDDGFETREDGSQTIRIYSVDGAGSESVLYEYVPVSLSNKPNIYRTFNESGAEYLRIEGARCDANGINCPTEDRTNFSRFYFRETQQQDWTLIDDMVIQTLTSNPTKIIQDLSSATAYAQFDNFGNLLRSDRNDYWFYRPGSGYGINLAGIMFNGATAALYENAQCYGMAVTPYGLAVIGGRRFNDLFVTDPALFFIQAE